MHRQKNHPFLDLIRNLGTNPHFPPAPLNHHRIPFHDPSFNGILEMVSRKGSGKCLFSLLTFPVRVMVCHWSLILPVVSIKGKSGLMASDLFFGPEANICALPLGV